METEEFRKRHAELTVMINRLETNLETLKMMRIELEEELNERKNT